MSESIYLQFLRDSRASNPTLAQQIGEFGHSVELYFGAAHTLHSVFEAQHLAPSDFGPYFHVQWKPADQNWNDAKRYVLFCGERLARAMADEGHGQGRILKRLLKLLNAIRRDGENSGCPGGVKLADWTDIEAQLQQLAMQAEADAKKDKPPAKQAEGTGAGSDPVEGEQAAAVPRTRGRKPRFDPAKDREIAEMWQRAKGAGVSKKNFAREKHFTLKALNRLLNRHAKRLPDARN